MRLATMRAAYSSGYVAGPNLQGTKGLGLQQAALVVSVLPTLVLFLLLQRFYVRGLMLGAVKG